MKLPDAGVYGNGLPRYLKGRYQTPDYVWATTHDQPNDYATIGWQSDSAAWTECSGEGKPVDDADYPGDDHAVRQVMMAGAAGLYHQISLLEHQPKILLFTMNLNIVRFFVMTATPMEEVEDKWSLVCQQVADVVLDLTDLMDCIRVRCFTRALHESDDVYRNHFNTLWGVSDLRTCWWLHGEKAGSYHSDMPTSSSDNSADDSNSNPMGVRTSQWRANTGHPATGPAQGLTLQWPVQTPSGHHRQRKWEISVRRVWKRTTQPWMLLVNALKTGVHLRGNH